MTWELPWATSGVTQMPVSTARVMLYAATGGGGGVVSANDLRVTQTSTPSALINVSAGVAVAVTNYPGASLESYVARNAGSDSVAIPNTGGAARYDFVYAHFTDPGQSGQPTSPIACETRVITNVSSTATKISDVPALVGQTGVPLARIYRPANSTIVSSANITDIRPQLNNTGSIGEIKMWPVSTPPDGWLICKGAAVSRTTYAALYSVIGIVWGSGDGSTTFNIPNFDARMPVGVGGLSIGTYGGNSLLSIPDHTHDNAPHKHDFSTANATLGDIVTNSNTSVQGNSDRVIRLSSNGLHAHGGATNYVSGGTFGAGAGTYSIQNPYSVVQFIIKAF